MFRGRRSAEPVGDSANRRDLLESGGKYLALPVSLRLGGLGPAVPKANVASVGTPDKQENHGIQCVHNDAAAFDSGQHNRGWQQECATGKLAQ
ncbi:MAG: hypothetical protein CME32_05335 [Gimesia sp.]|nr:hypothetical protein [Gimesia sp.]